MMWNLIIPTLFTLPTSRRFRSGPRKIRSVIPTLNRCLIVMLLGVPLIAQELSPSMVFEKVKASVVVVKVRNSMGQDISQGSGVKLPSGRIVTNFHVVKNGAQFLVGQGDTFVAAIIDAADPGKDLCLLKAPTLNVPAVEVGTASALKVGAIVYAVGSPQGLELSLSNGLVSQLRGANPPIIQTTAAISSGSSGGGLFDGQGRLVGITTFYLEGGQNLNFALPVEWIDQLKSGLTQAPVFRSSGDWLVRVVKLEEEKKYTELLGWCQAWVKADGTNSEAWYHLGNTYGNLKRYSAAIQPYQQALAINPEHWAAWVNLGITFENLNRTTEGIDAFRHALDINPSYASAWASLGEIYERTDQNSEAIEAFINSLKVNSQEAQVWFHLGNAFGNLAKYPEAIEAYRQALKVDPAYTGAWVNLGNRYGNLERYTESVEAYRQALILDPTLSAAWFNLGNAYGKLKRYTEAISACHQAVKIDPTLSGAWFNLGIYYLVSGNKAAALDVVKQLRRHDPENANRLFNIVVPK